MAAERYQVGSIATLLSTEMNSLANNASVVSSGTYDNSAGYPWGRFEFAGTFPTAPTANTVIGLWLLTRIDGTNFEDGSGSIIPARAPDVMFRVRAVTAAQRTHQWARLPYGVISSVAQNIGTGQTLAASGNTIKLLPHAFEGV